MPYTIKRDRKDPTRVTVLDPLGVPDTRLGKAVRGLPGVHVPNTSVLAYAHGGLRFFDHCWERARTSALPFSPWDPEEQVRLLFRNAIERLHAITSSKSTAPDIVHVRGSDDALRIMKDMIPGVAAIYESMIVNQHYAFANPFLLPENQRQVCFVPMPGGGRSTRRILTKFFFRTAGVSRPAPRTDDPSLVDKVVEALEAFRRCPKAVIMLVKVAIWGLARLREQVKLTIWDWWHASGFGELIDTTNKGQDEEAAKRQLIPAELVQEITDWGNGERQRLDRHNRTLDQWRTFLTNETKTVAERMRQAKETPLFPNHAKGFYSPSGLRDVWYAPAMRKAGLPTRFHLLRHAGINDLVDTVNAMDISEQEKEAMKLAFGRHLGWAWPERMIAWYSEPTQRKEEIRVASLHQQDRRSHLRRIAEGHIPPRRRDHTPVRASSQDTHLKRVLGFKHGGQARRKTAA